MSCVTTDSMAPGRLRDLLHQRGRTRRQQLVLLLASLGGGPVSAADIKQAGVGSGVSRARTWRVAEVAKGNDVVAVCTPRGWELTQIGTELARSLTGAPAPTPRSAASAALKSCLAPITDPNIQAFLSEAIACLDCGLFRAAVVLSWVGATAVLQDHVVTHRLADFNLSASSREKHWRAASNADDLGRMKERDFLDVLESMSILGKNVRKELQLCLDLRNACGHPNSLVVGENRVCAHVEVLILNVFSRF